VAAIKLLVNKKKTLKKYASVAFAQFGFSIDGE